MTPSEILLLVFVSIILFGIIKDIVLYNKNRNHQKELVKHLDRFTNEVQTLNKETNSLKRHIRAHMEMMQKEKEREDQHE